MKLTKIRALNYKSIVDSGDCYLDECVTVLAGKNESGKTSILEAIRDFDVKKDIDETAKPIKDKDAVPEIIITIEFDKNEINQILAEASIENPVNDRIAVEICKTYPNAYSLSIDSAKALGVSNDKSEDESALKAKVTTNWDELQKIYNKYPPSEHFQMNDFNIDQVAESKQKIKDIVDGFNQYSSQISDEKDKEKFSELIAAANESVQQLSDPSGLNTLVEVIKTRIPNFIYFNSFDDVFPNKVPFDQLDTNEWVQDLAKISDLDIETVKNGIDRDKHKHKQDINISTNKDYQKFWTQDNSNLSIDWDSDSMEFWIAENGYIFEPSLRSKGRQWHLAFYIKVSARSNEEANNIILIDEPGLFLHATAQQDILRKLESAGQKSQILFSTHSPYLLEPDKLDRVRLVYRKTDNIGTKIENKVHALADKETLTPILTAIGLEINTGITNLDRKMNVVVEGPSDSLYLNAFRILLKKDDLNFVFGGGAGNMPIVGTILSGWGCQVVYLYDNDQGKKDGEKNLIKNWLITQDLILSILDDKGSIEDIFSNEDFKKYILLDEKVSYSACNSDYIKSKKEDKVLLARKFLQLVHSENNITLSDETKGKIEKLFSTVAEKFKE